jgi:ferrous-iron efflux pump FieF
MTLAPNAAREHRLGAVALSLIALKGYASVARPDRRRCSAQLADSMLDLIASLVTLGRASWAAHSGGRQHRFGHGKAEAIAAFFQVVVISISAFCDPVARVRAPVRAGDRADRRIWHRRIASRWC